EDDPANNITLAVDEFACASDAMRVLRPYLTGRGLPGRVSRAIGIPSRAQTAAVIARNTSTWATPSACSAARVPDRGAGARQGPLLSDAHGLIWCRRRGVRVRTDAWHGLPTSAGAL